MIRDSVQSSAGLLKVHIFRCFQKISLILCNSDIIFRITFIIKLQTSCGAIVTLNVAEFSNIKFGGLVLRVMPLGSVESLG